MCGVCRGREAAVLVKHLEYILAADQLEKQESRPHPCQLTYIDRITAARNPSSSCLLEASAPSWMQFRAPEATVARGQHKSLESVLRSAPWHQTRPGLRADANVLHSPPLQSRTPHPLVASCNTQHLVLGCLHGMFGMKPGRTSGKVRGILRTDLQSIFKRGQVSLFVSCFCLSRLSCSGDKASLAEKYAPSPLTVRCDGLLACGRQKKLTATRTTTILRSLL